MSKKTGDMDLKGIPILTVIKAQALMRGFLARRRVKKVYGYEMSRGLMMRGTVHIEMDPQKLEAQRARVQQIREQLPEFEYALYQDEDYEPGVIKEQRPMLILQDGAQYEGEWSTSTDQRHGRGY
jgi:hypothetical protein